MKDAIVVRVGSTNRAKLAAVLRGLEPFFEEVRVEGRAVESGVPEQPIGLAQIVAGARQRARASWDVRHCQLAAGIEDGLMPLGDVRTGFLNVGCCVLWDGREEGLGLSAAFELPPAVARAVTGPERRPAGPALEADFDPPEGWPEPGPCAGNIGRLTGGVLDRDVYSAQAVTCAFLRLLHPQLYAEDLS